MLHLYLIRHGLAGDRQDSADDSQRPLTEEGISKTRKVAQKLQKLGLTFDLVQTSPYLRASQTAQILAEVYGYSFPLETNPMLAPEGDFTHWLEWLERLNQPDFSLGLVGHEPDLSTWAEILIWGEPRGVLILKKAGVIGLTLPPEPPFVGKALLFLLVPPKILL
jgi:phosphohistidine phosphatase, SixA